MRITDKLKTFLDENAKAKKDVGLSESDKSIFRALNSAGERAVKGRDIDFHSFDSLITEDSQATLRMFLEGRHSMSVGHQLVKRFDGVDGIDKVDVVPTKRGAKVVIRPKAVGE
jgi:hypothetical protein